MEGKRQRGKDRREKTEVKRQRRETLEEEDIRETERKRREGTDREEQILDKITDRCFLVDICASFSIFPRRSSSQPHGPHLLQSCRARDSVLGGETDAAAVSWLPVAMDIAFSECPISDLWHELPPAISSSWWTGQPIGW
jgi:hypothetical protein